MKKDVWIDVHLSKTYSKFIHEHAVQLRSEFANIASIYASKNVSSTLKSIVEVLKKSYDSLFEKFLNQFEADKILTDTQTRFERTIIAIKHQTYEQTRALEDLADVDLQTEDSIDRLLKSEHDAFEIRLLIKIQKKHNVEIYRAMREILICQRINERVIMNTIILKSKTLSDSTRREANQWTSIVVVHQLKSDDMKMFIRSHEKIETLLKNKQWFQMFEVMTKLHLLIFEMIMSFMRVKDLQLDHEVTSHLKTFRQHLYSQNCYLRYFNSSEDVIYAKWLTKKLIDKKFTSIVVKFDSSELTNEVMTKNLNYANSSHETKRYIRNCKLRQCFRCWSYNHYVHQCSVDSHNSRCRKYVDHHNIKKCSSKHSKCVVCQDKHQVTTDFCFRRKSEQQRLSKTRNLKKISYFTKSTLDTSFTSQITFSRDSTNFFTESIAAAQKERELTISVVKSRTSKNQITLSETNNSSKSMTSSSSSSTINIIMNSNAMIIMKKRLNVRLLSTLKKTLTRDNAKKRKAKNFSISSSKNFEYESTIMIFKTNKAIIIIKSVRASINVLTKRRKVKNDFDSQNRQVVNAMINALSFTNNNNNNAMNRAHEITTNNNVNNNNNAMNRALFEKQDNAKSLSFNDANDFDTNSNDFSFDTQSSSSLFFSFLSQSSFTISTSVSTSTQLTAHNLNQICSDIEQEDFVDASNQSSFENIDQFFAIHVKDFDDSKNSLFLTSIKKRIINRQSRQLESSLNKRRMIRRSIFKNFSRWCLQSSLFTMITRLSNQRDFVDRTKFVAQTHRALNLNEAQTQVHSRTQVRFNLNNNSESIYSFYNTTAETREIASWQSFLEISTYWNTI